MKKGISFLLAFALMVGLAAPVAAETRDYGMRESKELQEAKERRAAREKAEAARSGESGSEGKTAMSADLKKRTKAIKEKYNIAVSYSKSVEDQVPLYLDDLEAALAYLGPSFVKRISNSFNVKGWSFKVEIVPFPEKKFADRPWIDALFTYNSARGYENKISLYVKPQKQLKVSTVVHEFGHALHNCLGYNDFAQINGGKKSYQGAGSALDEGRYATRYAATDHFEDFAETFRVMVMRDSDASAKYGELDKNSVLYKKYHYIYGQMNEFLGTSSVAAKQAAKFLQI